MRCSKSDRHAPTHAVGLHVGTTPAQHDLAALHHQVLVGEFGGEIVELLDEPTEGIQPSIIKDIGRVIRMLADRRTMAIVLVEQYYDFAAELADQYLVMERGEIVQRGRGEDMQADGVRQRMSI